MKTDTAMASFCLKKIGKKIVSYVVSYEKIVKIVSYDTAKIVYYEKTPGLCCFESAKN